MNHRILIPLGGLAVAATVLVGCGGACGDYCGLIVDCYGAQIPDQCQTDIELACVDACNAGLDAASGEDRDALTECLDCAIDNVNGCDFEPDEIAACESVCTTPQVETAGKAWSEVFEEEMENATQDLQQCVGGGAAL